VNAAQVTYGGPAALAEAFISLLEKQGLTVAWTRPSGAPTAKVDVTLTVSLGSGAGSLKVKMNPVVKRFQTLFPALSIKMEGQDDPTGDA
jgi:hypothetical protein